MCGLFFAFIFFSPQELWTDSRDTWAFSLMSRLRIFFPKVRIFLLIKPVRVYYKIPLIIIHVRAVCNFLFFRKYTNWLKQNFVRNKIKYHRISMSNCLTYVIFWYFFKLRVFKVSPPPKSLSKPFLLLTAIKSF